MSEVRQMSSLFSSNKPGWRSGAGAPSATSGDNQVTRALQNQVNEFCSTATAGLRAGGARTAAVAESGLGTTNESSQTQKLG